LSPLYPLSLHDALPISNDAMLKSLLERLCLPHRIRGDSAEIREDETLILRAILKPESRQLEDGSSTLERLSILAGFPVKSKAPKDRKSTRLNSSHLGIS